ncbi:MAG TPA: NDP-sugar synthase [Acidimicrobiales bacterium]|nr:NDP-sugar synthase [Acidimicrobiales bacterium]
MRAVVLVGGEGTRLRPLTYTVPKQLLPIAGVTMLERVVGGLARHGVDDVVLSMGYRPDAFREQFPDGRAAGVTLTYAVEPEPRDTAGAIRFAADAAGIDDTFLVVNGDVLTDLDVGALIAFHRGRGGLATIALTPVEDPSAFGVVPTDAEGRVTAFIEKPPRDLAPTNLINAGTYVLEPEVLALIPPGGRVSIERETFPILVGQGRLFAMASDAYWLDTGTPAQYLKANLDLLDGSALVEPGSSVAPTARVCRSVVGAGARVEDGAEVRDSVLLPDAVVGAGAVVDGSIVGARARIGARSRLAPVTVVGCDVEVAAGRVLVDERVPA